jgi:hypothetical protein
MIPPLSDIDNPPAPTAPRLKRRRSLTLTTLYGPGSIPGAGNGVMKVMISVPLPGLSAGVAKRICKRTAGCGVSPFEPAMLRFLAAGNRRYRR